MRIAEIFHSLQGEGELAGVPSVFIRTSGCNLRCRWCDTPYASWNPEGADLEPQEAARRALAFPAAHAVLTGGEPMAASGIHELATALRAAGRHITVETAGTLPPGGIACDLASISPKLANSTPSEADAGPWHARHESTRLQPGIVREWIRAFPCQLKFVVQDHADLDEIRAFLDSLAVAFPPHKVLLMPEGRDEPTLQARAPWLAEQCKVLGFRYCARLQIALFGNTRGT